MLLLSAGEPNLEECRVCVDSGLTLVSDSVKGVVLCSFWLLSIVFPGSYHMFYCLV